MHAVARLALHPVITNIQTSWVKMGYGGAAYCLDAGANDLGGTLMNESITRAAGAVHGQEMPPEAMEELIRGIGRSAAPAHDPLRRCAGRPQSRLLRRRPVDRAGQHPGPPLRAAPRTTAAAD